MAEIFMNPEDDPSAWLLKAGRDLALVRDTATAHANDYPDLICYHCQRSAEKYLKALLAHHKQPVRRTHDLEELLDLLSAFDMGITADHYNQAIKINDYAVLVRYPGFFLDFTEADVQEAFACAEFFQAFALRVIGK